MKAKRNEICTNSNLEFETDKSFIQTIVERVDEGTYHQGTMIDLCQTWSQAIQCDDNIWQKTDGENVKSKSS